MKRLSFLILLWSLAGNPVLCLSRAFSPRDIARLFPHWHAYAQTFSPPPWEPQGSDTANPYLNNFSFL
ncbi:MAG: hypothetical protein D6722_24715 [Bacteroidetes bacterium]|nr:MAG: hypothetical protein D6722_24715 [Bacteroidota bacterium]